MTYYLVIFAAGFAGSFHCIGMCGGFACALGHDPRGRMATAERHLLYNVGRLTTYCFLGVIAGTLGEVWCTSQGLKIPVLNGPLDLAQRFLAIAAGLLMIAMALQFFGLLQGLHRASIGYGGTASRSVLAQSAEVAKSAPRRLLSACSTASFRARWSMRSPPRRRAPPERFPACSSCCRSDWEPFPPC